MCASVINFLRIEWRVVLNSIYLFAWVILYTVKGSFVYSLFTFHELCASVMLPGALGYYIYLRVTNPCTKVLTLVIKKCKDVCFLSTFIRAWTFSWKFLVSRRYRDVKHIDKHGYISINTGSTKFIPHGSVCFWSHCFMFYTFNLIQ